MCIRSTGGRPASRLSRFVYVVLCSHEAAREAETGRVLFASVSVVMKGHVFAEDGSCGAVQWGELAILLTVKQSKIVRFKNTSVLPFIRKVSGVLRECISYIFTHGNCTFKFW